MTNNKLESKIDKLTNAITEMVSRPVAPIAPVAPVLPIAPQHSGDHDLLTSFRAETIVELKTIKDTLVKIQESSENCPNRSEFNDVLKVQTDHEARMRVVETAITKVFTFGVAGMIILGIIQFLVGKFL